MTIFICFHVCNKGTVLECKAIITILLRIGIIVDKLRSLFFQRGFEFHDKSSTNKFSALDQEEYLESFSLSRKR